MMKTHNSIILSFALLLFATLLSCNSDIKISQSITSTPPIYPDYAGVTIPYNIAPLRFKLNNSFTKESIAILMVDKQELRVKSKDCEFLISNSQWRKLMNLSKGKTIHVTILAKQNNKWIKYKPFDWCVSTDPIDPYIAYRLIEPGYETWYRMGIYQRNLENFSQSAIIENRMTDNNCMNCHSFCMQNPRIMLFHMRAQNGGTFVIMENNIEKLNTKTDKTISALVYPSWHPSGNYVVFSVNNTAQFFHSTKKNRVEVYDIASDIVVYDVKHHSIKTSPLLSSAKSFETFPTFSPDGKKLYFCSADSCAMPQDYSSVKYSLCSIEFNPSQCSFGNKVDTLVSAYKENKSVSFPRVSPNGKYLCFTLSNYGNFSIWHKSADLWMLNLMNGKYFPLTEANSSDVESYHSWSSNSRWIVFSSRRIDGLYTRPYFTHINNDGKSSKPFLLPQSNTEFYKRLMKSYNIPEFIKGKVNVNKRTLALKAKKDKGIDITVQE